jgi:hypothetical protein
MVVAPSTPPTKGPIVTGIARKRVRSLRRRRSTSGSSRVSRSAETSGSTVLVRAKPTAEARLMSWSRSIAASVSPAVRRIHGHQRRFVSTRAARVTPAGGKKTASALGASRTRKQKVEPAA